LKEIFKIYEEASGQKINFEKSAVAFSSNMEEAECTSLSNILQVPVV
jgi:hypothetical protein